MTIVIIDDDTVKETIERIIDLKVLRQRISDINSQLLELQALPDLIHNDMKDSEISRLRQEKQDIKDQLTNYGVK